VPGRLAIYDDIKFKDDILKILGILKDDIKILNKKYNIAPTINIPVFLNTARYTYASFGLIPSWAKDKSSININARGESIYEKVTFKESFKNKRCLIPINGYYEWKKDPLTNKSIPYIIKPKDDTYFALAGIYDIWYDESLNQNILTTALITTEPNNTIKELHDRMPVILDKKDWKTWLSKSSDIYTLNSLLKPSEDKIIEINEVSELVNSIKNDSQECLDKTIKISKPDSLFDF
jgi:putative SOS response-associated peptidase YedK